MVRDQFAESLDAATKLKDSGKTIRPEGDKLATDTPAKKATETALGEAVAATVAVSVAMTMPI